MIELNFKVKNEKYGINADSVYLIPTKFDWGNLGIYTLILVILLSCVCYGTFKIASHIDDARRASLGYISMAMLSVVYFQYFGNYVMFLLIANTVNFLIYTLGSLCLLVMAFLTFKLAFFIFMTRNANHPEIRANGFRSPRGKFVFYWLLFMLVNYVSSTILVRYLSYSYYLIGISCFPIVSIIENIANGFKRGFNLYSAVT